MNKERRQKLEKALDLAYELQSLIEEVKDEEEEAMENVPESLHETERYQAMEDAVNELIDAGYNMDCIISSITNAQGE